MKYIQFKDIKHQFPKDSWLYVHNEKHEGEFDEDWVIYIDHDMELENLNLDTPFMLFKGIHDSEFEQKNCLVILVNGNLTAKNIYNEESDGSTCLYVLGNVEADHIIVGGQELYIAGNMNVKGCFWGHYNHGDLVVKGKTSARVFTATEGYHYDYKKTRIAADFFLCDEDDEDGIFDRTFPKAIFSEEILYTEEDIDIEDLFTWNDWLCRSVAIKMLEQNTPILNEHIQFLSKEEKDLLELQSIPTYFENTEFKDLPSFLLQLENFQRLMNIVKLHDEEYQYYTFGDYEVQLHPDTEDAQAHVMFTHSSGFVFFICIIEEDNNKNVLSVVYKENEDFPFIDFFEQRVPIQYIDQLNLLWNDVLIRAERGAYFYNKFLETVIPEEVIGYLNLPVIQERYNSYKDDDKNSFWYGGYCFMMRIHGERGLVGSIDIGEERETEIFDMRTYCLRPNTLEHPEKCNLFYSSSQEGLTHDSYSGNGKVFKVFLYDWELFREAVSWYPKIEKAFTMTNEEYLEETKI
ncbi:hypothetical protein EG347_03670 [Chryseobacterium sp. G0186]|uniref:hypothetical protein n=1 Tax=Chryseobacterium sp. G0186 TaxID=2487064 RepID=UPI000F511EB9|nr:hypothetical protein [Chryseobacterium sp. G0186]AZA76679.1 hypothetical protein EG347_03670 [Chryseobacterium sp. G0186]